MYGYYGYSRPMYFLLHHSTGALLISANSRHDAVMWGQRQLGEKARLMSVLELPDDSTPGWVERSGTGLELAEASACKPEVSLMADSMQRVSGLRRELIHCFEWQQPAELRSSCASVH
jgi:hypothetical protein